MSRTPSRGLYKWTAVVALGAITVLFTHCGKPMGEKGSLVYSQNGVSVALSGTSGASSLAAFSTTVYPITRARCANCHGASQQPLHASSNVTTAHNAVIGSYKVDFSNIPNSRLVQKLKAESHNCWSNCTANAMEMQLAIEDWKKAMESTGGSTPTTPGTSSFMYTTPSSGTLAAERATVYAAAMPSTSQAQATSPVAPMQLVASSPSYITVTSNNTINGAAGSTTSGFANFMLSASAPRANGALWGLVQASSPNDDAFNIKVNAGNFVTWNTGDTGGVFKWVRVTNNGGAATFNLNAGANTVTVSARDDGTKLAAILYTTDLNFNPGGLGTTAGAVKLKFSLNSLGYPGAFLEVQVEDYDAYSYKLSQLKLVSPSVPLMIKGVHLLINGSYSAQNANFTTIDQTVPAGAAGTVLTPSSMIVLKVNGEASDSFSFGMDNLSP